MFYIIKNSLRSLFELKISIIRLFVFDRFTIFQINKTNRLFILDLTWLDLTWHVCAALWLYSKLCQSVDALHYVLLTYLFAPPRTLDGKKSSIATYSTASQNYAKRNYSHLVSEKWVIVRTEAVSSQYSADVRRGRRKICFPRPGSIKLHSKKRRWRWLLWTGRRNVNIVRN